MATKFKRKSVEKRSYTIEKKVLKGNEFSHFVRKIWIVIFRVMSEKIQKIKK